MEIRSEHAEDVDAIRAIITAAFKDMPFSNQTEAAIVGALREAGALTLSLVAVESGEIFGHVAFSPVTIYGVHDGWYGLGPVAARPDRQRSGIGRALIEDGLAKLRSRGAKGCVVLGDPAYYGRFGFAHDPNLRYAGAAPRYFQRLVFSGLAPKGDVEYHASFDAH